VSFLKIQVISGFFDRVESEFETIGQSDKKDSYGEGGHSQNPVGTGCSDGEYADEG
jgi:hypothetical protein